MKKILLATFLMLTFANVGLCYDDGDIGYTSTGTIDISLTIPSLIVINGLSDFTMGELEIDDITTDGKSVNQSFCVSSNIYQGDAYSVTATAPTASGTESGFVLRRASTGEALAYSVYYSQTTTPSETALSYDTKTSFEYQGGEIQDSCTTRNSNVKISFTQAALHAAKYGSYSGTLSLLVEPN